MKKNQIARYGVVLEVETGNMDGKYMHDTEEMAEYWHRERPQYTHVAVYTNKGFSIPDDKFLANVRRKEAKRGTL